MDTRPLYVFFEEMLRPDARTELSRSEAAYEWAARRPLFAFLLAVPAAPLALIGSSFSRDFATAVEKWDIGANRNAAWARYYDRMAARAELDGDCEALEKARQDAGVYRQRFETTYRWYMDALKVADERRQGLQFNA